MRSMLSKPAFPVRMCGLLSLFAVVAACASAKTDMRGGAQPRNFFHQEASGLTNTLRTKAEASLPEVSQYVVVIGILDGQQGHNNLNYLPSELHVPAKTETRVTWVSWDGPFKLWFRPAAPPPATPGSPPPPPQKSPLKEVPAAGEPDVQSQQANGVYYATRTIRFDAIEKVAYHFVVLLTAEKDYWDLDCPPIIVGDLPPPANPQIPVARAGGN